jgi:hypothetical protein
LPGPDAGIASEMPNNGRSGPDLQQFNSRPRDSVTYRLVPDVIQPDLPRARQLTTPKDGVNIDNDRTREKNDKP